MPTISEIQDYLKKNHPPEDIPDKTKERVTRQMAEGVKKNEPLPSGRCNACGREDDRVVPMQMRICPTCASKFMNRGGELLVMEKEVTDINCDNCLIRTFTPLKVNPRLCNMCSHRLGRTHKYELKDMRKKRAMNNEEKKKRFEGNV